MLPFVTAMAIGPDSSVYLVDRQSVIRQIGLDGMIRRVAGTGVVGATSGPDGGQATQTDLKFESFFQTIAVGPDGSIYMVNLFNTFPVNRVRRVGTNGTITTVSNEYADAVGLGPDGGLYLVGNNAIRRIMPDGSIENFAGIPGIFSFSGDGGPAVNATMSNPSCIAFGRDGSVYFCDTNNNRVRRVSADGSLPPLPEAARLLRVRIPGRPGITDRCSMQR